VGLPSPRWGEQVTAFVVPTARTVLEPGVLHASAARVLAASKQPKACCIVAGLPRNQTGKVMLSALAAAAGTMI
jgi:malonyl-CoA/methylmalonyl-CoA synthetase